MNVEKLSKRLETVTSFIEEGMSIADIGSDHAYLPCYAVNKGLASFAIAGEVVDGPYQSARQQVVAAGLTDRIDVRKGNGLAVLSPGEVDCIIIAGMGGSLITEILEVGKAKLVQVRRLILQPNIAAEQVRKWLLHNNWGLVEERLIEEDGKFYEVLVAELGGSETPYRHLEKELLLGPFLLKEKSAAFQKKWQQEMEQWEKILQELNKADNNEKIMDKRKDIMAKIAIVKEELR